MKKLLGRRNAFVAAFWNFLGLCFLLAACSPRQDFNRLPLESKNGFNAVIATPAGSNALFSWNSQQKIFKAAGRADLLPCPVNLGFLPGWRGNGPPPMAAVIAENFEQGAVVEVLPLALLRLRTHEGQIIPIVILYPQSTEQRAIRATTFRSFMIEYDAAKRILETWFQHYQGFGRLELVDWEDEAYALRYIRGQIN